MVSFGKAGGMLGKNHLCDVRTELQKIFASCHHDDPTCDTLYATQLEST